MSEKKQAVGTYSAKEEERGEWVRFTVDIGTKYPLRLATKLPNLIAEARALRDQEATWTYTEQESDNINPNSGKPYINRYLEGVEAGAHAASTDGAASSTASGRTVVADDERQRLIIRQSALNRAVDLYTATSATPIGLLEDAERDTLIAKVTETAGRFERWVCRDTSLGEDFPAD